MTATLPEIDVHALRAERARRRLDVFLAQAWDHIEPARPFMPNWHVDAICEHLAAVARGQIKRLLICQPPGSAKSTIGSVTWPSWVWTWRPTWKLIGASYAHNLAVRDAMRMRDLVRSDWYRAAFGVEIRDDIDRQDDFANTAGGRRLATSVGAGTTGWRADALLIDDALPAAAAFSKAQREECWRWFTTTMTSRLDDPANAAIVVVGQRLATDDLPGRLLAEDGASWEQLILPSEHDAKRSRVTSLGWRDPRTEPGEPLFPAMYGADVLAQVKREMGSAAYSAQHLQDPVDAEGGMFKPSWWRFWHPGGSALGSVTRPPGCWDGPARALPERFDEILASVDAAFKGADTSDFVVMQVWGVLGAERFLLEQLRRKLSFTETVDALRALAARWPTCRRWLVEDKANGSAIIDTLRKVVSGIVPVTPKESKEARAAAVSPQVEAGQVFLPDGAPFLEDFVTELAAFPRAQHDDQVDALSQTLNHLAVAGRAHTATLFRGPFATRTLRARTDTWGRPIGGYAS